MAKTKIVHLITATNLGGAETMLYKILSQTDRARFDPVVVSLIDCGVVGKQIEKLGIPVHTVGMKRGIPTPANVRRLAFLLRKIRPHLIHGWMYHGSLAAQIGSRLARRRIPIIWAIHHTITDLAQETRMTRAILRLSARLSRFAARIVYVSQTSCHEHEQLGFCKSKSCVIPNGFDLAQFEPSRAARSDVRGELGLAEDTVLIGMIGRFHPLKDHANFLRAAALLAKQQPHVRFVLAGLDVTLENDDLRREITELGLADRLHLLGERRDVPRLMAALDIIASSSSGEAFPLVVGEAMACETPCVVTDVGDSALLVGDSGLVVPPRDPQALADAWQNLVEAGADERRRRGQAARRRIEENFSLDSIVRRYQDLYRSVL